MICDLITLDRPLISVDLETTGLYPHIDRVVQIGVIKVYPDGTVREYESLIDPGVPIPPEVSAIHHIDNNTVKDSPLFETIARKLHAGFVGCDFCGYNCKAFDIKFLVEEFRRADIEFKPGRIVDAFNIFKHFNPRNLTAAVKHYLNEDLVDAHSAMADARAALRVFRAQLLAHENLPRTIAELDAMIKPNPNFVDPEGKIQFNKEGQAIITFGAQKGVPLKQCDRAYMGWILRANFSPEIKKIITDALGGKYPERK